MTLVQGCITAIHAWIQKGELIAKLIDSVASDFCDKGKSRLAAAFSSVLSEMDKAQLDQL